MQSSRAVRIDKSSLGSSVQDLKLAARQLRRSPVFTLIATLTLALGIGATTSIFSLVHAILLQPLPFAHPEQLQAISTLHFPPGKRDLAASAGEIDATTYGDFFDWRDANHSFQNLAAYDANVRLFDGESGAQARVLDATATTAGLFELLGVRPILGRTFSREEEKSGNRSIILSHELWVSDFGSAKDMIGRKVRVSDRLSTVVGVMPSGFRFPLDHPAKFWFTCAWNLADAKGNVEDPRTSPVWGVVGRLKSGLSTAQASADLNTIQRDIARHYPARGNNYAVAIAPEVQAFVSDVQKPLKSLMAAVAGLLLIACANVAGLLLGRGTGRTGEMAVRAALGASRWRVMRPLLAEALLLGATGGMLGVGLAWTLLHLALRFVPQDLPRLDQVRLDWNVLLFAAFASLLCSLAAGLLPAWRMRKVAPAFAMREGSMHTTAGRGQHRLHSALVIGEIALGLVLLVCSGLLMRSFEKTLHVDPGFNPQHLLTTSIALTDSRYTQKQMDAFFKRLMPQLRALPGVQRVSAALPLPLSNNQRDGRFEIVGQPAPSVMPDEFMTVVEPGLFETLADPLLRGRLFTEQDHQPDAAPVAIINQAFANKYFPGQDPIGQHLKTYLDIAPPTMREIVGVVGNMKRVGLQSADAPEFFVTYAQALVHRPTLVLRVAGDPAGYVKAVQRSVASLDPGSPLFDTHSMVDEEMASLANKRFETLLFSGFAAFALLLTAVGLYGVLAYTVAQRTREVGLRMALGAGRGDVVQMILGRGLALAGVGLAAGMPTSVFASRLLADMLFGITPLDPITYLGVTGLLLLVAVGASLAPAVRAAQVDPIRSLREN